MFPEVTQLGLFIKFNGVSGSEEVSRFCIFSAVMRICETQRDRQVCVCSNKFDFNNAMVS